MKQLAPLQQLEFLEAMQSQRAVQQSCALADGKTEASHEDSDQSHHHTPKNEVNDDSCSQAWCGEQSHNHTSGNEVHVDSCSQAWCGDQRQHQGPAQDVAAFGRLIVQLYRGRRIYHPASDHRWVLLEKEKKKKVYAFQQS